MDFTQAHITMENNYGVWGIVGRTEHNSCMFKLPYSLKFIVMSSSVTYINSIILLCFFLIFKNVLNPKL